MRKTRKEQRISKNDSRRKLIQSGKHPRKGEQENKGEKEEQKVFQRKKYEAKLNKEGGGLLCLSKGVLSTVSDIEEPVFVLVFVVDTRHESDRGRKDIVDQDEDVLLFLELDALAD